jgi:hypothetical protein
MRTRFGSAIGMLLVAVLAGCGGSTKVKTVVHTVAPAATTTAAPVSTADTSTATQPTTSTPGGPPDCNAAGFNDTQLKQGTCVSKGTTLVIVNKESVLHLKSLNATLKHVATQHSLSDGNGQSATATGKFEVFTITLKNKLDTPQQWADGQARLLIATSSTAGNTYTEDFTAENGPDQNSCTWKIGSISSGIQPGESTTCDVIFDIPPNASLSTPGSTFDIENFGEADTSNPTLPVGIIRTYH